MRALFNADSNEGFSADELAQSGAFADDEAEQKAGKSHETASQRVIRTLYDTASAGLIRKTLLLTAYVRYKWLIHQSPCWKKYAVWNAFC